MISPPRPGGDINNNFFVFQPLLPEVAGGSIHPADTIFAGKSTFRTSATRTETPGRNNHSGLTAHHPRPARPENPAGAAGTPGDVCNRRTAPSRYRDPAEDRVRAVTASGIETDDGLTLDAETIIAAIGNAPSPLMRSSPISLDHGRIVVDRCLRVEGLDDVWALGDNAHIPLGDPNDDKTAYAPPLAQFAFREAKVLAGNILAHLDGRPLTMFEYRADGATAWPAGSGPATVTACPSRARLQPSRSGFAPVRIQRPASSREAI